jgi:hypothetical protein
MGRLAFALLIRMREISGWRRGRAVAPLGGNRKCLDLAGESWILMTMDDSRIESAIGRKALFTEIQLL